MTGEPYPRWEDVVARVNIALEPVEQEIGRDDGVDWPVILVVGPPRSGTTLATQVIIHALEVGYIDNLAAAFGKAPAIGVALSRHVLGDRRKSTFGSNFGQTSGPMEPHEFGYYWLDLLGYRSMTFGDRRATPIDFGEAQDSLYAIARAWHRPIVMKSFIAAWHLAELKRVIPNLLVVRSRRPHADSAVSIFGLREARHGSRGEWVSVMPPMPVDPIELNPSEQVAAQALFMDRSIDVALDDFPASDLIEVDYARLIGRPQDLADSIADRLSDMGFAVPTCNGLPDSFPSSPVGRQDTDYPAIVAALARLGNL